MMAYSNPSGNDFEISSIVRRRWRAVSSAFEPGNCVMGIATAGVVEA